MERDTEWITIPLWTKERGRLALHWLPFQTAQRFETHSAGGGEMARRLGVFSALGDRPTSGSSQPLVTPAAGNLIPLDKLSSPSPIIFRLSKNICDRLYLRIYTYLQIHICMQYKLMEKEAMI